MSKIDLDPITSGYNLSKINANFQKVEDELNNKVLYRNSPAGEPNSMSSNLDMNSRSILNANKISSNILELGGAQVVPANLATDPYNGTREALRRSYAEAGYHLVDGSFEVGGTLVNNNDVLLHEASGKGFTGPAGTVAAGTNPSSGGFVDVSDKINPVVSSVAELKAIHAVVGCIYRTKGYYSAGDGGDAEYVAMPSGATSPDGYGDHLAANGVVLQLVSSPTDLNHGVKLGPFVAANAWNNRNALQAMLRNQRWSYFELTANGTYYVLGSVHPLRDNITVHHKSGCKIIGRYNDTSIPASFTSQGGHLFGFAKFIDPDNGQFLPVTGSMSKVNYVLDGDISTEFNSGHSQVHNNNCIGYYKADDCHVTGFGGVSASDHRGVNFDGLSINCHIDIGYASGTADEPLVMKSDPAIPNRCSVKVGAIKDVPFGGPNQAIAVRVQDCPNVTVEIGSFVWDGVTKPQLVGAFNCNFVGVDAGDVNGVSQLLRQYETFDSEVCVQNVKNTQYGIVRAGVAASTMRSALLTGIKSVDSTFIAAYRADINNGTFASLTICDNNFSGAANTFKYYDNRLSTGIPARYDLHDNISPSGFSAVDFNPYRNGITDNLVTPGATTFSVNYKSPDWLYSVMTVIIDASGLRYLVDIDLRNRDISSINYTYPAGPATITSSKSGSTMTLTVTGGTFQIATMHN